MTQQTYLVLFRDGKLSLAVAAALQDRLALDGHPALALVPSRSGAGLDSWDYLRQAPHYGESRPQVVAIYEDGLLELLESLGLCAYVGVPGDRDWRVLHWGENAGAMLLPVATARDLVDAVAEHVPWHDHATAPAVPLAGQPARRHRLVPAGRLSRRIAVAGVAGPLLAFGLPAAAAAAQTTTPQAPPAIGSVGLPAAAAQPGPPADAQPGPPAAGVSQGLATGITPPSIPAPGSPAAGVNSWWNGLTQAQQQQVTNVNPAAIGSLDGIPSAVRDYANRQELTQLTQQTQGQINDLQNMPPVAAEDGGMGAALMQQSLIQPLQTKLDGLNALQTQIGANSGVFPASNIPDQAANPNGTAPMYLLGVDTNGLGHFIVAVNNPDSSDNVVTFVPGINTNLSASSVNSYVGDASSLASLAGAADPSSKTSVVTWYAYNAPQSVPAAISSTPAIQGASALNLFQDGIYDTNADAGNLLTTGIGHSYGSTVIGQAAQLGGLNMNAVALIGSPGTDWPDAAGLGANLRNGDGSVFAATATNDIIYWATGWPMSHGADPVTPAFGATVFDAGDGPADFLGIPASSVAAHGYYFDPSSPAMANMANIIVGNYDAVTSPPSTTQQQTPQTPSIQATPTPPLDAAVPPQAAPTPPQDSTQPAPAPAPAPAQDDSQPAPAPAQDGTQPAPAPAAATAPAAPAPATGSPAAATAPAAPAPATGSPPAATAPAAPAPAPAPVPVLPAPAPAPVTVPSVGTTTSPFGITGIPNPIPAPPVAPLPPPPAPVEPISSGIGTTTGIPAPVAPAPAPTTSIPSVPIGGGLSGGFGGGSGS